MSITLIHTDAELENCILILNKKNQLAIDLEFDKNYYRYGFNLCLVQIFDGEVCWLIDPLSKDLEIRRLFPVLEDPKILKVVFAFGEDLRLLHSIGCFPKTIYDLDIVTSLLNYPPASLTNLVDDILEIDTGKSSQTSNWYKRPLSEQQINYAVQDVLHLFKLKKLLDHQAAEKEITGWIDEENLAWDLLDYSETNDNGLYKEKDKNNLNEVEWHVYKHLIGFREEEAKKADRPGFQIIRKEYLVNIAKDSRTLMQWNNTKGIYRGIKNEETKQKLLELVKRSRAEASEMGLSESEPARKVPGAEEMAIYRQQKSRLNALKTAFFDPIKRKIEEDYGEETATYLLSNRIVSDIVSGNNGKMKNYKRDLLLKYAEDLKLDINTLSEIVDRA